jgi:hypothetical protein
MAVIRYILYCTFGTAAYFCGPNLVSQWYSDVLTVFWRYKYTPLRAPATDENNPGGPLSENSTVRLLQVIRADQILGIQCSMTELQNLSTKDYHCLSYTWGDPFGPDMNYVIRPRSRLTVRLDPLVCRIRKWCKRIRSFSQPSRYIIRVDDGFLSVTPNLWSAIIHLHKSHPEELNAIWIDAICINQKDNVERSAQVSIMHQIYACAKSVVTWLGPEHGGDENMAMVKEVVEVLHKQENARAGFCEEMWSMKWGDEWNEFPDPSAMRLLSFEHWFYVRNFLQRSYFERMWIFQEIVLAKTLVIVCGSETMDLTDLRDISHAYSAFGIDIMTRYCRGGMWTGECHAPHRTLFWREKFQQNRAEGLRKNFGPFALVTNRAAVRCGDARDMLYGLIGVCKYDRITPDYAKPVGKFIPSFGRM